MKPSLIPTVITDKNGKTTTVYRKPKITKTNRTIPAPATQTPETNNAVDLIALALYPTAHKLRTDLHAILQNYPSDLLDKMIPIALKDPVWRAASRLLVDNAPAAIINETLYFYPHMGRNNEHFAREHLKSLHHYPQLPATDDYSTADDRTRKQCIALLIAIEQLQEASYDLANDAFDQDNDDYENIIPITNNGNTPFLSSPELIDLIMERPDRVQEIIDTIIERQTADADTLRIVLTDSSPAIAKGNL